jgi:hypothetical protein
MRHALTYCIFLCCSLTVRAQQEQSRPKWFDTSLQSCVTFDKLSEHYEAAYHVVTDHYETIPNQERPVAVLKGIENPQKLEEFMNWYGGGGNETYSILGDQCEAETLVKDRTKASNVSLVVENEKNMVANFFIEHIVKRYNSLVKDYNSLLTTTQTYVSSSQAYFSSIENNNRQLRVAKPVFIFPKPQSLNCTGDTTAFSTSMPYPGSVSTITNASTTIHCY